MRAAVLAFSSLLGLVVAGCGPSGGRRTPTDGGIVYDLSGVPPGADLSGLAPRDMAHASGPCSSSNPCPAGQRCYAGGCIPDNGSCASDNDCENDSYCACASGGGDMGPCAGGVCVPWGDGPKGQSDPSCQTQSFSVGDFKPPALHCKWTDPSGPSASSVVMTPLIIDVTGDGIPEIVFSPMNINGGGYVQSLVAIKSSDCSVLWNNTTAGLQGFSQIAAADLDGDKLPEIVGVTNGKTVKVFDHNGQLLAQSSTPYSFSSGGGFDCSGPSIADVDNQFPPEIIVAGQVLRYTKGNPTLQVLWTKPVLAAYWGTLDAVADLDGDNKPEVVVGKQVLDGITGNDKTPSALAAINNNIGAYPAVADFNKDGKPDVVVVQSTSGNQSVAVVDVANDKILFGPYTVTQGGWGGPPTVADFDGDGVPDFGLSSTVHYYVYALKCAQNPKPADCQGPDPGVLWESPTHDVSSGGTASSVFDFNGDGKAEVVYRDECWLRVYNGPDGKTVFAANVTSGTALELPVIGDIDNDGHADIVVPSDNEQEAFSYCPTTNEVGTNTPWTGYTAGVLVYRDPMNRWMPSRGIWNENAYHITNVNDDTTVPTVESPNWKSFDDYRQNVQGAVAGMSNPQTDYTGGASQTVDNGGLDCKTAERLWAQICNRGAAPAGPGVPGTFYTSDPRQPGAKAICTTSTTMTLAPGQCEAVHCDWQNPPSTPQNLWFRADDDGTKQPDSECKPGNDLLQLPNTVCNGIG